MDQPGDQTRQCRNIDARHTGEIDQPLLAVVGKRREHAPHRDAHIVPHQHMLGEIGNQRRPNAIDEIWQVVVEIEMGASAHGPGLCRCRVNDSNAALV